MKTRLRLMAAFLALSCSIPAFAAEAAPVPAAHIAQYAGDRAAAISYTFDDGLRDQYTLAVPMLNEVGFKGTFFVIPNAVAQTTEDAEKKKDLKRAWGSITWSELKEMAAQGHEIASHTWSHPNLGKLTPEEVDAQFSKAQHAIQTHLAQPALTVAFPFNASTPEIQAVALKYHVAYRAYQTATGAKTTVASLSAWADMLVQEKKWGVIMVHAIGSGYSALSDPEILRAHFKEIKGREHDIWVDTFANVARYVKERDDAKLTLSGKAGSVTCLLTGTLNPQIYNVPLTLIFDVKSAHSVRAVRSGQELPVNVAEGSITIQVAPSPQPISVTWK